MSLKVNQKRQVLEFFIQGALCKINEPRSGLLAEDRANQAEAKVVELEKEIDNLDAELEQSKNEYAKVKEELDATMQELSEM
ncbi:hypothetical protein AWC38_SpisGene8289 [Stylophora pistillata]|uniref:Tropomyosin n=1 Tax=Stylophora pistillata TaxID=50429 RepID=A0A2B4SEJ7_STYPI|nr:hypothetical protein AWC38_SpisGene8289 [Stylophora pistillata]